MATWAHLNRSGGASLGLSVRAYRARPLDRQRMLKDFHKGTMPMTPESEAWVEGLRMHASAARIGGRSDQRPAVEIAAERALLAAHLVAWFDTELPGLLAEREGGPPAGGRAAGGCIDPEPAIVITTTAAGCAAAAELLDRDDPLVRQLRDRFACVTELEYRQWCMQQPDDDYRLHIAHWSWMKTRVPPQWWPKHAGESYWLHRTGTAGAGRERRSSHLWKWNGTIAAILKPFVDEAGSVV